MADRPSCPRDRHSQFGPWVLVAFGLGAATIVGLIILLSRRRDGAPVINIYNNAGTGTMRPMPAPVAAPLAGTADDMQFPLPSSMSSRIRTITLPAMASADRAVRIAWATEHPARVIVRAISPPGGIASIAYGNGLDIPDLPPVPLGDSFAIPVGADVPPFRLAPHQYLYAKGNVAGVVLSVAVDYEG